MTITIDLPSEVAIALTHKAAQEGRDVPAPRTPGLHAGRYWIADDFDAPLPDDFWLGEEVPEQRHEKGAMNRAPTSCPPAP